MKRLVFNVVALLAFSVSLALAAGEHANHGSTAHEEVVDGVKATFTIQTMKEAMKAMGMAMPKGIKETHHFSVGFTDVKTGKALTEGQVLVKVQNPDKTTQTKDLQGMQGHFGGDFELAKKGQYGVMSKFQLKDGKIRQVKFWYTVK